MKKFIKRDICIVGGGASAMAAAITFGRKLKEKNDSIDLKEKIIIVEKNEVMGKKVAASGNGRCNLTNEKCPGIEKVLDFFEGIGLMVRCENGWFYPYSEDGKSVSALMGKTIEDLGIDIALGNKVEYIKMLGGKSGVFSVYTDKHVIECKSVLLATGGKAAPFFGTTGDGYKIASSMGHKVNRLIPILTPVDTAREPKELGIAGVRQKCKASLKYGGDLISSEEGQVQFTPTGLSGICIFNLSRYVLLPDGKTLKSGFGEYVVTLDLCPDISNYDLKTFISRGKPTDLRSRLCTVVKPALADYILHKVFFEKYGREFTDKNLSELCENRVLYDEFSYELSTTIRDLQWEILRPKGWDFCQGTKGGIPLEEINLQTMESKIVKGLYFAGEVIDYDGPCGGYNLHNAWETGLCAGEAMALEELNARI